MGRSREPKGFSEITHSVERATALIGICTRTVAGTRVSYSSFRSLGSGFFVNRNGLLLTSNHVIDQVLGPNDIFFGFQKNGRAQARFWFTTTVLHRFLGIDVATLKFDSCFSSLPLSPKGASQGDEIGVYGFPAASIQIDGNGSVQRDTAWPKVAKTVVGCAGVMTKTLGSVVLQDKELLEAQFMFVGGNSGGPIFCAKTGKVLGIVTGVQNLPQGAFQVNTQNLGNQVAIPLATYAVGISIKEVTQLLERAHYTHWW